MIISGAVDLGECWLQLRFVASNLFELYKGRLLETERIVVLLSYQLAPEPAVLGQPYPRA